MLHGLARRTGFVRRQPRKLELRGFLLSCMVMALQRCCSLRQQAILAGLSSGSTISKQGLHQRLTDRARKFLQACLAAAIGSHLPRPAKTSSASFGRILVQDSTCLSLPAHLATRFPGPSNQSGKPQAGLRIQCVYELLTERFISFALSAFTRNDQASASDLLALLQPGDLVLRDLGYFTLKSFKGIAAKGAFFISRLRYGLTVYDARTGQPLNLRRKLRPGAELDLEIRLGQDEKLPLRLLAFPLPENVANERRRKARADRDKRIAHSKDYLDLLGWSLFVTNAPADRLPRADAAKLYRLRWRIEIIFKAWKSHFGLAQVRKLAGRQVEVLVYGLLLFAVLTHHHLPLADHPTTIDNPARTPPPLSLLRLTSFLSTWLLATLFSHLDPAQLHQRLRTQINAHCRYDRRRRTNYASLRAATLS